MEETCVRMNHVRSPCESRSRLLVLIAAAYVGWGVLRALSDVLVAAVQQQHPQQDAAAMVIHTSFFAAYLLFPIPIAILVRRHGAGTALALAATLMGAGALLCAWGLHMHQWGWCFVALFVIAAGIAAVQTSGNPAIMMVGGRETGSQRLLFVQCLSSVGSIVAPALGYNARGPNPSEKILGGATLEYIAIGSLLFLLAGFLVRARWSRSFSMLAATTDTGHGLSLHPFPAVGVGLVFLFVGTEATILSHVVAYWRTTSALPLAGSGLVALSGYWFLVATGRIAGWAILYRAREAVFLSASAGAGSVLVLLSFFTRGSLGAAVLIATGLVNAVIFPLILSHEISQRGPQYAFAISGWLTTAICGGAVMPLLSGMLADRLGVHAAFALPLASYLWIAWQAHRWQQTKTSHATLPV